MSDKAAAQEIKEGLMRVLNSKFGFCGVAESDEFIMLNSGEGNLVVKITWEKDAPAETKEEPINSAEQPNVDITVSTAAERDIDYRP